MAVIPVKAGIHCGKNLDARLREHDKLFSEMRHPKKDKFS
ncbi:MAG: hypothetical protein DHS20C20_27420 [Ardenticatenaceae bacterium]|nr:MAG: hypothetical protein DHS20C20_27420 [Ardenticatenaceae bacterium]